MSIASWSTVAQQISKITDAVFTIRAVHPLGRPSTHATAILTDLNRRFFVKYGPVDQIDMFRAEALGLSELATSHTIAVAQPICWGTNQEHAYLVLEYLVLTPRGIREDLAFGRDLAALHTQRAPYFGWHISNTIGATTQINTANTHWAPFWRDCRLAYQLDLAHKQGHSGRIQEMGHRLLEVIPTFFTDYVPTPAPVHGDLWAGNCASANGRAIVFDPAVYYGDPETDIAMTELFGGFSPAFYDAYHEARPLDSGYTVRKTLYNLYHVLNHLNLMGGGYLHQAEQMILQLLAEVKA